MEFRRPRKRSQITTNLINKVSQVMGYYASNHASQKCPLDDPIHTDGAVSLLDFFPRVTTVNCYHVCSGITAEISLSSVIRLTWKWPLTVIVRGLRKMRPLHEISVFMVIVLSHGTFQEVIRKSGLSNGSPPTPPPCHCYSPPFRVMSTPPVTALNYM